MKTRIFKLMTALMVCIICSVSASAQYPCYGTYQKKGNGYTITAKFDLRNKTFHGDNGYIEEYGDDYVEYSDYYGYIEYKSGGHTEGYNIIQVVPSGDGPMMVLAPWQFPKAFTVYPILENGYVKFDPWSGEHEWLDQKLTKVGAGSTAKKATAKKGTAKKATAKKKK